MPQDQYQNGYNTGPSREESQAEISETARAEEQRIQQKQDSLYAGGGRSTETEQVEEQVVREIEADISGEEPPSFWVRRRKGIAGVLLALFLGGGGIGGFFLFSSYELVHIMENLYPANFSLMEDQEANRSIRHIQRKMGCNRGSIGGNRICTGNPLADKFNDWRLRKFEAKFQDNGWRFEYTSEAGGKAGRATRLVHADGTEITFDKDINPREFKRRIKPLINDTIPTWRVGKRIKYRRLIAQRSGFDWSFFLGRKARNAWESAKNRARGVDRQRSGERVRSDVEGADEQEEGESDSEQARQEEAERRTRQGADSVEGVKDDIRSDVASGQDLDTSATKRATSFVRANKGSVIILGGIAGCIAHSYAQELEDFDGKIYKQRILLAARLMAAWNQMKEGDKIHNSEVGSLMELFHDNKNNIHYNEGGTWGRTTGDEVDGDAPDSDLSYNSRGEKNTASIITNKIGRALNNFPGFKQVCGVIQNQVVQFTAAGAEILLSSASIIGAVIREAVEEVAFTQAISYLFKNLTFPEAVIPSNPIMFLAQLDMSMNLSNVEHSRSIGAPPATDAQVAKLKADLAEEKAAQDRQKGFVWRYLSPNNRRSLISQAQYQLMGSPPTTYIAKLLNFPNSVQNTVSTAFSPIRASAYAKKPFDNYDIQQFAFKEEDLENINLLKNNRDIKDLLDCAKNDFSCSRARWEKGERAQLLIDACMLKPYWEAREGSEGKDDWVWRREVRAESQDRVRNTTVTVDCNERTDLYVRTGMFIMDNYIGDNMKCLSTDKKCDYENFGTTEEPPQNNRDFSGENPQPGQNTGDQTCEAGTDEGTAETYQGNTIRLCNVGGIVVNASISAQTEALLQAARSDGVEFGGSGFRSWQRQAELRKINGCPDLTSSSSTCRVPTAPVGSSLHEQGLAIDFSYNGSTICYPLPSSQCTGNRGFNWLEDNAGRFGLKNLPSEAWHWSVNGR